MVDNSLSPLVNNAFALQKSNISDAFEHGDFYEDKPWTHKSMMRCYCLWRQSQGHALPRSLLEMLVGIAEAMADYGTRFAFQIFKEDLVAAGTYYTEGVDDDDAHLDEEEQRELKRAVLTAEYEKRKAEKHLLDESKGKHGGNHFNNATSGDQVSDETQPTKRKRSPVDNSYETKVDNSTAKKIRCTMTDAPKRGAYTLPPAIASAIVDSVCRNDYIHEKIVASRDSSGRLRSREELIVAIHSMEKNAIGRRVLRAWAIKRGFSGRG